MPRNSTRQLFAVVAAIIVATGGPIASIPAASATVVSHLSIPVALRAPVAQTKIARTFRALYPLPAPAVQPEPCAPGDPPPGELPLTSLHSSWRSAMHLLADLGTTRSNLLVLRGKGIWITDFPGSAVHAARIVRLAVRDHLQQLWVRVGSTANGFYGGPLLRVLVPKARAHGIYVIAWDFPTLTTPSADAKRASEAFQDGADAFSPDIETPAEGTDLTVGRVTQYLSRVRRIAGNRPVVATVPPPTTDNLVTYPYASEAPFIDAFAPMVYWSCLEPGAAVANAIAMLSRFRPVDPIGQDYNMASEGGRVGLPSGNEIWRFLNVAERSGAIGASLYDLESGGSVQLQALASYPW